MLQFLWIESSSFSRYYCIPRLRWQVLREDILLFYVGQSHDLCWTFSSKGDLLWWLVAPSSAAAYLSPGIKEKTPHQLQIHRQQTPTHAFRTHRNSHTYSHSGNLIFRQRTAFVSGTCGGFPTNADFLVSDTFSQLFYLTLQLCNCDPPRQTEWY